MIKKFIFGRMFDFLIAEIDENWDELVAQGKKHVIDLLNMWRGKLVSEGPALATAGDTGLTEFAAKVDEAYAAAEAAAPAE